MKSICLDLETYSSVDIGKSGVYRYAESPDFEILLFACSVDGDPVQVYDLACGEKVTGRRSVRAGAVLRSRLRGEGSG